MPSLPSEAPAWAQVLYWIVVASVIPVLAWHYARPVQRAVRRIAGGGEVEQGQQLVALRSGIIDNSAAVELTQAVLTLAASVDAALAFQMEQARRASERAKAEQLRDEIKDELRDELSREFERRPPAAMPHMRGVE